MARADSQGNHDSEIGEDRAEQMRTLMNMPYSVAKAGPKTVDGVGNCGLEDGPHYLGIQADI